MAAFTTPTPLTSNHLDQLQCMLINVRSLGKHATEIWDTISTSNPDVVFITETWLKQSSAPDIAIAVPKCYKKTHRDCPLKPRGGIAIMHKETIIFITTEDGLSPTMEHLNFQLHINANSTIRGTLAYRPSGPAPPSATPSLKLSVH
mgnify:CR=1 FL=1